MKIVKRIVIILLCIIALPFLIALFIPNKYVVSVTETINQPVDAVHNYVRMLKNQKDYSVWVMADPNLEPEIVGTDGTVGAIQKWNSQVEDVGEGEQEITVLTPERIEVDLRFKRPWEGHAKAANIFKPVSEKQCTVTSEFYSEASYPFNLPAYLFGRKFIEDAEKKNLANIKRILES